MKIAIDVTYTPSGGSLSQILNMIKYLDKKRDVNILIFTKKSNDPLLNEVYLKNNIKYSRISNISKITRVIWQQLCLPFFLKKEKIDVLFSPGNISPYFSKIKKIQWIGTIGPFWDEIHTAFPGLFMKLYWYVNKFLMYKTAQKSDMVVFESEYTKSFFQENYKIKDKASKVINIGKDKFFLLKEHKNNNAHSMDMPFILCVSHLYPYKNIINMIEAISLLKNKLELKHKILIAGAKTHYNYYESIVKRIKELNLVNDVILLGSVSKNELKNLYLKCDFLVFPSPCENFAYTLVEAMCCGVPITCSNTTAMPETCDTAAIYFDPDNVNDISEKMELLIKDNNLKNDLKINSLLRVKNLPDYYQVTETTYDLMRNLHDQ
jgi:glycosyltransferase involved in cell wall biosynthesis